MTTRKTTKSRDRDDQPLELPEFGTRTKTIQVVTDNGEATKLVTMLLVRCPREDCHLEHMVARSKWLKAKHKSRACPYCFKTALVPGR